MSTHFNINYNEFNEDASPIKNDVKIKNSHSKLVANNQISERNKKPEFREKVSNGVSKYYGTIEERFLSQIKKVKSGCWEYPNRWIGSGEDVYQPKVFSANYYKLGFTKECIIQICKNSKCVNPQHLIEMTKEEHALDMISKRTLIKGDAHHKSKLSENDIKDIKKLYKLLLKKQNGKSKGIATIIHKQYNQVSLARICQILK
jgi:hypothetical protein